MRRSLSVPPPQIRDAASFLDAAVTAHLLGMRSLAEDLIRAADMPEIYRWLKPIWANNEQHVVAPDRTPWIQNDLRVKARMPSESQKEELRRRDGAHCRFCEMPLIRSEVRARFSATYPSAARWGRKESEQHTAFQAMWTQYDHIVPHSRGGTNDLHNMVLTCAACNFGRGSYSLDQVGVDDPRLRPPIVLPWDGLERFR